MRRQGSQTSQRKLFPKAITFLALAALLGALGTSVLSERSLAQSAETRSQQAARSFLAPLRVPGLPLTASNFTQVNEQGFGDRQNSYAWSMQWWQGKLYVGTNRAFRCVEIAAIRGAYPDIPFPKYPPDDPDIECAPTPQDLPLQAEIWRYTPETGVWERVYQSPNDVPIPGYPGKFVARDIGFRDMEVFVEPDGTEALYISGVSSKDFNYDVPLPRLLRTTDGVNFEAVPQDPGTTFGSVPKPNNESLRTLAVYKDRLYVVFGSLYGAGSLYEAENPAGGNDNFRRVSPEGLRVFEMAPYNGYLYIGTRDPDGAYAVLKTDASGTPPYSFTVIVPSGAYRQRFKSQGVISMYVFKNRLYVGTDKPAELIRINPDDTWDLVVGAPRDTPFGYKEPISGMSDGFDWALNVHMWRMGEFQDWLYVGTVDASTSWHTADWAMQILGPHMGFDFMATRDGWYFFEISRNGFGDIFDFGIRNFATTPYGLFFGTGNYYYGTKVYLGVPGTIYSYFLPTVTRGGIPATLARSLPPNPLSLIPSRVAFGRLTPPQRLEVEDLGRAAVLSWLPPAGAVRFHVFRAEATRHPEFESPELGSEVWVPGPYEKVAVTDQALFLDTALRPDRRYYYYVLAEDASGRLSSPSNLVRVPSLAPKATVSYLERFLAQHGDGVLSAAVAVHPSRAGEITTAQPQVLRPSLEEVRALLRRGELTTAQERVTALRRQLNAAPLVQAKPWLAEDLDILLGKLTRRLTLAQMGFLSPADLE